MMAELRPEERRAADNVMRSDLVRIRYVMRNSGWGPDRAMELLGIPHERREHDAAAICALHR